MQSSSAANPITVEADGLAHFDLDPVAGATTVWIEVESPGIAASDVVVRLGGVDQTVTTTAFGAIAIVPASGSIQHVAVGLTTGADPDIAVTVIDAGGTVLFSTSYHVTLVDFRTIGPQGSGLPDWLVTAGPSLALAGFQIAGLALVAGFALVVYRRKAVTR